MDRASRIPSDGYQAADISGRLKRRRLGAHTVQVKVRYGDFGATGTWTVLVHNLWVLARLPQADAPAAKQLAA